MVIKKITPKVIEAIYQRVQDTTQITQYKFQIDFRCKYPFNIAYDVVNILLHVQTPTLHINNWGCHLFRTGFSLLLVSY